MTPEQQLSEAANHDPLETLNLAQAETLHQAVAKIVMLGAQKGITAEKMIELLKSGLTVGELLDYLAAHTGDVA